MKILFVIGTPNKNSQGNGGHYYSLLTTAEALSKKNEVIIVHIGVIKANALEQKNIKIIDILSSNLNTIYILKRLREIVLVEHPSVLHSFDHISHFYTRIVGRVLKIPVVHTKCGGMNPKFYYPFAENLILYSEENYKYFKNKNKFRKSKIHLIPNRVSSFENDKYRIEKLKIMLKLEQYEFVLLRITRIGHYYKRINNQLINLFKGLKLKGINCCLIFIGHVEVPNFKIDILNTHQDIYVVDDNEFTVNAKAIIDIANLVHGTGRGFMEACAMKKIMLVPNANLDYPLLFSPENSNEVLFNNISERYIVKNKTNFQVFNEIYDVFINLDNQVRLRNFNSEIYHKFFSIETAIEYYSRLYDELAYKRSIKVYDIFLNYLFVQKYYYLG